MSEPTDTHYLFLDFESDGYMDNHPERCAPLEVGWLLADWTLERLVTGVRMLDPRTQVMTSSIHEAVSYLRGRAPKVVRDMHDATDLWADLRTGGHVSVAAAEEAILHDVFTYVRDGATVRLAGKGVGPFDLPLVKRLMPDLAKRLDYAPLDLSPIRRFHSELLALPLPEVDKTGLIEHRAAGDVFLAWQTARQYREHFAWLRGQIDSRVSDAHAYIGWLVDQLCDEHTPDCARTGCPATPPDIATEATS